VLWCDDRDISQAIAWIRTSESYALTPTGKICRALGKLSECGGCIRLFVERMRSDARMAVPAELRWLRHRSGGHAPAKPVTMTQLQKKLDTTR
jgi:hypothetical protein